MGIFLAKKIEAGWAKKMTLTLLGSEKIFTGNGGGSREGPGRGGELGTVSEPERGGEMRGRKKKPIWEKKSQTVTLTPLRRTNPNPSNRLKFKPIQTDSNRLKFKPIQTDSNRLKLKPIHNDSN